MNHPARGVRTAGAVLVLGAALLLAPGHSEAGAIRTQTNTPECQTLGPGNCFDELFLARNDDGSIAAATPIGFPINFFGQTYSNAWVNNNGNITFDGPLGTYTPFPISNTSTKIIAPFFADVDTRNSQSGLTRYGAEDLAGNRAWGVTWIDVGYYASRVDKKNSFQLVIIEACISPGCGDFNIEFNYDKIQWETGDASGGSGGLGGNPARAGFSNGTTQPGTSLELPGSATAGAFLDSNTSTGLIRRSLPPGQLPLGRYVFEVRGGRPVLADLQVTSTDSPDPWSSGPLTYTFTVEHLGDGDPATPIGSDPVATSVRLTNVVPANLGAVTVDQPGICSFASGTRTVTCNIGTLVPAQTFTVTVTTNPTAASGTFLVNTATVTGDQADPFPANNSATARTNANDPDVLISQCNPTSTSPPPLGPGKTSEGAACTFQVTISRSSPLAIVVTYATSNGTAIAGTGFDYTAAAGNITFAANHNFLTPKTFTVATLNDTQDEDDETFTVRLTAASNANLVAGSENIGTIVDNDNPPTVSIADCTVVEGDSGLVPCDFTVSLNVISGKTVKVDYLVSDGTGPTAATIGSGDFTADTISGTLFFTPGKQTHSVRAYAIGDANVETHETYAVTLTNLEAGVVTAGDLSAVGTIQNDDGPVLAISDVTVTETDSTNVNATYTVTLTPASANPVVMTYFTSPGTATSGVDYTAIANGTLSFTAGQTVKTFNVVVRPDLVDEPDETYTVTLNPATFASIPDPVAEGLIIDNDGAIAGRPHVLVHGSREVHDLAAPIPGVSPAIDWFAFAQDPYSSYEVVVDEVSGDLGENPPDSVLPLRVNRMAADQNTVVGTSVPVGVGSARSLRWANASATADKDQWIKIQSAGTGVACDVACAADDTYRIRFYDTTGAIPRFNNAGAQVTVLILQNLTDSTVTGTLYFWKNDGLLAGSQALSIPSRQTLVLNTTSVTGVAGQSGTITVVHTAGYGGLAGKTVALDPTTGFSFDTPMLYRPR